MAGSRTKKGEKLVSELQSNAPKYVVGIGASAGGLEALQQFLEHLSPDTGLAFVVIQHLSPDYKSLLAEILSKYTTMPVVQSVNEMILEQNTVYLIPPRNNLEIHDGCLFLTEYQQGAFNHPIDVFFRSLAEEMRNRAVAVVLSGTGSDGTNGIKAIKEQNGFIIIQKPESAKFDGMPKSALQTGLADLVLTPIELAAEMTHISRSSVGGSEESEEEYQGADALMRDVYTILKQASNINYTYYKKTTILRRIERRMVITHRESLRDYVDFLSSNLDEAKILAREVLIGVTSFFRDPEHFETLQNTAIVDIVKNTPNDEEIRVWVAGCSTGEEAYSVAILFSEVMENLKVKRKLKIFATDLDVEAITVAAKGTYNENIIENVSSLRLSKFFIKKGSKYSINRDIRKMIIFAPHNVFQDPPFGRLDLICCRNMLIYFQPILQKDLFGIFHMALKNKGYLFLGKSESISDYSDVFVPRYPNEKIFLHKRNGRAPKGKNTNYVSPNISRNREFFKETEEESVVTKNVDDINLNILEQFMPASIVVNENNEVRHTFGDYSNYIHFPLGKISLDIFSIITDDLRIAVSTALKAARKELRSISYKDIPVNGESKKCVISLTAMPLRTKSEDLTGYFVLVFNEQSNPNIDLSAEIYNINDVSAKRITDLEQELRESQDRLKLTISELESVNEELQAANEELLTANEELQSSNEELQSVNEELYTVNAEYQQKLAELTDLNDDVINFLSTTLIGIMFVDNDLCIRRFTNYITSEFNIMEHDIGRSIKFIAYNFEKIDIVEVAKKVLSTLVPDEREIVAASGKSYFLRVAPYRTNDNKILGLVITFVDLSEQQAGRIELNSATSALEVAKRASNAKSAFLSRMSHEIRTPMNAIIGMTELAMRSIDNKEVVSDCLNKTVTAAHYLVSIVNDILDVSKIESSSIELCKGTFNFGDLIENVNAMIKPAAEAENIVYECKFINKCADMYYGDKTRLQQIVTNFLNNAVKFTPAGGRVNLTIEEIFRDERNAKLKFVISDTGIGISEEFMPLLFTPFERENKNTIKRHTGSGLGMAIAKTLVELMHGDIQVESRVGEGTTFTATVDLGMPSKREIEDFIAQSEENYVDYDIEGLNILVVEDNELNILVAQQLLISKGANVTIAENGILGVEAFMNSKNGQYDAIMMDICMPEMDGLEAARRIRESERREAKTIPIIAMSANAFDEDVHLSLAAGMNAHLAKPIEPNTLFRTLNNICKRKGKGVSKSPAHMATTKELIDESNKKIVDEEMKAAQRELERQKAEDNKAVIEKEAAAKKTAAKKATEKKTSVRKTAARKAADK